MLFVCITMAIGAFSYTFIYPAESRVTVAWWYRFMSLSMAIAADKVIVRMKGLLVLSDYHGRILQVDTGTVEPVKPKDRQVQGPFLGIADLRESYPQINFRVAKGDQFLIYSDSMLESTNATGEQFCNERLMSAFKHAGYCKISRHRLSFFCDKGDSI